MGKWETVNCSIGVGLTVQCSSVYHTLCSVSHQQLSVELLNQNHQFSIREIRYDTIAVCVCVCVRTASMVLVRRRLDRLRSLCSILWEWRYSKPSTACRNIRRAVRNEHIVDKHSKIYSYCRYRANRLPLHVRKRPFSEQHYNYLIHIHELGNQNIRRAVQNKQTNTQQSTTNTVEIRKIPAQVVKHSTVYQFSYLHSQWVSFEWSWDIYWARHYDTSLPPSTHS